MSRAVTLSVATVTLCIFAAPAVVQGMNPPDCNKLHAAFTFRGNTFLVYGNDNNMIGLTHDGHVAFRFMLTLTGFDRDITAAVGNPEDDAFYLMEGRLEHGFDEFNRESHITPLMWSSAHYEFIITNFDYHGIDAAFKRGDLGYYISGCKYVSADLFEYTRGPHGNVEDVNLPCYPDAAWTTVDGQKAYIVKGHQLFTWELGVPTASSETHLFDVFPALQEFNLCD